MSYYLGLSFLSYGNKYAKNLLSAEARRILSVFKGGKFDENDVSKEAGGRPFFFGGDADFNISHSGNMVAVSYTAKKGRRVGCDIEKIKPRPTAAKIAKDKFSADENRYLYLNGIFDYANFYRLWTLKESYIKLRGISVFDMSKVPSFLKENEKTKTLDFSFCAEVRKPLVFRLYELTDNNPNTEAEKNRFILAEAMEGKYLQPELLWLSSLTLDCKMIAEIKAAPSPAHTVSPNI